MFFKFVLLFEESHAEWPVYLKTNWSRFANTFTEKNVVSLDMENFISGSWKYVE